MSLRASDYMYFLPGHINKISPRQSETLAQLVITSPYVIFSYASTPGWDSFQLGAVTSWFDMWYEHSQTQVSVQNSGPMGQKRDIA